MLKVDLRDVRRLTARAGRHLGEVDSAMQDVVEASAARMRANDPYQNRTGHLRGSTLGEAIQFGPNVSEAQIQMGMYYASFVIARGFATWEDEVIRTESQMGRALSAIANKITRSR